jgi:predicted CopG family antitoxin
VTSTKTIAVSESVWERLKEIMKRQHAGSLNEVVTRLIEEANGIPPSKFGARKGSKLRLTQKDHEEITKDVH